MGSRCRVMGAVLACMVVWSPAVRAADNELTEQERGDGFVLLFNGKDLSAFRKDPKRDYNKWIVRDGTITLIPAEPSKDPAFTPYPLWTVEEFSSYVLKVDFCTLIDEESGHSS